MSEDSIENYEILNILNSRSSSALFKVKNKSHGKFYLWHSIPYENYTEKEKEELITKINERLLTEHSNLVKVYKFIEQKEGKIIYIVHEFFEKGSLHNLVQECLEECKYITEELLCKIIYQIVIICKTTEYFNKKLSSDDIFLDEEHNIKLLYFSFGDANVHSKISEPRMCQLGFIMYNLCTLKRFDKTTFEKELRQIKTVYSANFISLILCLMKDTNELKKNINKILCHPTVLKKSSQWSRDKCFVNVTVDNTLQSVNNDNEIKDNNNARTLQKLRDKEFSLLQREQIILEKEHMLLQREKKVAQLERTIKEKLQQAELYLKRSRTTGSKSSLQSASTASSSKSSTHTKKKISHENLDSTYVSCGGESVVLPTSKKLDVENISKPKNFTRTMTEKKIRFKGHSPLKETNFNRKSALRRSVKEIKVNQQDNLIHRLQENIDDDKENHRKASSRVSRKSILFSDRVYENDELYDHAEKDVMVSFDKRATWTEKSKKYAFELLKVMNSENENVNVGEVKHTYL